MKEAVIFPEESYAVSPVITNKHFLINTRNEWRRFELGIYKCDAN